MMHCVCRCGVCCCLKALKGESLINFRRCERHGRSKEYGRGGRLVNLSPRTQNHVRGGPFLRKANLWGVALASCPPASLASPQTSQPCWNKAARTLNSDWVLAELRRHPGIGTPSSENYCGGPFPSPLKTSLILCGVAAAAASAAAAFFFETSWPDCYHCGSVPQSAPLYTESSRFVHR